MRKSKLLFLYVLFSNFYVYKQSDTMHFLDRMSGTQITVSPRHVMI